MKSLKKNLEKIRKIERKKHHPLLHKVHKKHNISRKTLFYIKEYGPHANVPKTIIKESMKILVFASVLSALGGLALEHIKTAFVSVMPIIILMPVLNGLIGNYGIVMSSHVSAMLHEGKSWKNKSLRKLVIQILIVAFLTTLLSAAVALAVSGFQSTEIAVKVMFIALFDVLFFVSVLCAVSVAAGIYFFQKGEDPNNFLIPITTAIADFGNMVVLAALIIIFF